MSDSKNLKSLGNKTKYSYKKPDSKLLETFINQHPNTTYLVPFIQDRDEFTSLCPVTGQPDYAKMEIIYIPNHLMIESKSLKLYLMSFRNSGEFHEDVCNRIANDIFHLIGPKYLRVYGNFAARGGIAIRPIIQKWQSTEAKEEIKFLVESFDRKLC